MHIGTEKLGINTVLERQLSDTATNPCHSQVTILHRDLIEVRFNISDKMVFDGEPSIVMPPPANVSVTLTFDL